MSTTLEITVVVELVEGQDIDEAADFLKEGIADETQSFLDGQYEGARVISCSVLDA